MQESSTLYVVISYKNDMEIIICRKSQFLRQLSEKYGIRMDNIALFDYEAEGLRPALSIENIRDGMILSLLDKSQSPAILKLNE
ncbi:hypothetical protein TNCT_540071 [Trichonephila clavata]|uniref:Uncharacterized protein n=1 Tax=Trichonephila clavata TaxID=2740835 RepID=A0A8X6H7C0_TRICU|nr:hypothetical protein TNCT_540071 [Trichonephila clavata]